MKMKYFTLFLILTASILMTSILVNSQDGPPPQDHADRPGGRRPNLLAELGLSQEQVRQIRLINQGRRPAMQEAQQGMRDATRNLDVAIYGDVVSESDFQLRLNEFHAAQAKLARLRFESELAVRKVLTPDQLVRFRDLRHRLIEGRGNRKERPWRRGARPQPQAPDPLTKSPSND